MEKASVSKSGIKVYEYKNPSSNGFFISLFLRAGSMFESDTDNGITHFFEHIAIRNVNKIMGGELYRELDRHGIEFNASTYYEMVQFYVSGASGNFDFGARALSEILSPVILSSLEIDSERRRIKAEIRESDDKNSLSVFSGAIVHEGTSLKNQITGTLSGVNKINRLRIEEFRKKVFNSENMFFYVTGNFTEENIEYLKELIDSHPIFEGEKRKNIAPVSQNFGNRPLEIHVKNADYTMVRFTFDVDMQKVTVPELDLIYDILLSGYSSRFFIEMSEVRGLFYDLSGAVEGYDNIAELYFSYEVREKDVNEAVKLTVDILKGFKERLLDERDLMKSGYVDNAYMLYDNSREMNFTFAYDNHIMDLGYSSIDDRIDAYRKVNAERIRAAACDIFTPRNLTLTVKGKKRKINCEELKSIIGSL